MNGVEECDDGNNNHADECTNECKRPFCGDGIVNGVEECDDGNAETERCQYGLESCVVCSSECNEVVGELVGYCGDVEVDYSPMVAVAIEGMCSLIADKVVSSRVNNSAFDPSDPAFALDLMIEHLLGIPKDTEHFMQQRQHFQKLAIR